MPLAGTHDVLHPSITCFNCQGNGHYASACPKDTAAVQLLQVAETETPYTSEFTFLHIQEPAQFSFNQYEHRYDIIPASWVLLDSQSTVSVFKTRSLLTNIRRSRSPLRVHTNGGTQLSSQMGTVKNFCDGRLL